jgi:ribosomal protein L16 Arg81 hydroxylase
MSSVNHSYAPIYDWFSVLLLNGITHEEFFGNFFNKNILQTKVIHSKDLPNWQDINRALNFNRSNPKLTRLARLGHVYKENDYFSYSNVTDTRYLDSKKVYSHLYDGATLIMNNVHEIIPSIRNITNALSWNFQCRVQANAYMAFREEPGFGLHKDVHDTIIVQLEGSKKWDLYGFGQSIENLPKEPIKSILMHPGDVLYVPKGYWHDVRSVNAETLHLTLGITPPNYDFIINTLLKKASAYINDTTKENRLPVGKFELIQSTFDVRQNVLNAILHSIDEFQWDSINSINSYGHETLPSFSLPIGLMPFTESDGERCLRFANVHTEVKFSEEKIVIECNMRHWTIDIKYKYLFDLLLKRGYLYVSDLDARRNDNNGVYKFIYILIRDGVIEVDN